MRDASFNARRRRQRSVRRLVNSDDYDFAAQWRVASEFVEASGAGPLLVSAFGRLVENQVDGELTVDTGHVVAFESGLQYQVTKAGKSWFQSWLAGEGLVMKFSGQGRLLTQSHNPTEFGASLGPLLPATSAR